MHRKELVKKVTNAMREMDMRKPVMTPKHTLHISDDDGNKKDFILKQTDRSVIYTTKDVENVLDALRYVIQEAMKVGEPISIHGFGTMYLKYVKPHTARNVYDGTPVFVSERYKTSFTPGNDLKRCAQVYAQSLQDRDTLTPKPFDDEDEEE